MKIKNIIKPVALLGAAAMLISASGCADTSWSYKTSNKTLTNGGWIYYTYDAMNEGISKIQADDENFNLIKNDLSSKKIEDKNAVDWINAKAKEHSLDYLTIFKLAKDFDISVDEENRKQMKKNYKSYFDAGYMDIYKDLGVGLDTFVDVFVVYPDLEEKVFQHVYGKDGSKAVKDEDIQKYFTDNYTSYYYIPYSLKKTDSDGNETDVDDETKDKVTGKFADYANELNKGKTTDDIEKSYKKDFETETVPSVKATDKLEDSTVPEDVQKVIKELDEKKATVKTIDNTHYLIYKGSISDKAKELTKESTDSENASASTSSVSKDSVLHKMKDDDFKSYLEEERKKLKVDTNDACLSKYSVDRTIKIATDSQKKEQESSAN